MSWLDKATKKYEKRLTNVFRGGCLEISTLVVQGTPVDKGTLRKSWTPSIGSEIKVNNTNDSSNNILATVRALEAGDNYNLANGQPYARRIEYEGYSSQAPAGMVRVATAQWDRVVKEQSRKFN